MGVVQYRSRSPSDSHFRRDWAQKLVGATLEGCFFLQGAKRDKRSSPGKAAKPHTIKNWLHPRCFARYPVGAEANTRGMPIKLDSNAYWVAVNRILHRLAMKAA